MVYRRKVRPTIRKKKRWYLDARFGQNVPVIGGTGIQAGSGLMKRMIKNTALKTEETKELIRPIAGLTALNTKLYALKLSDIPIGNTSSSRVGDRVFYCNIRSKFKIEAATSNAVMRVWVVRQRDFPTTTSVGWTDVSSNVQPKFFRNADISDTSVVNSDYANVLCSFRRQWRPQFTGDKPFCFYNLVCKLMRKFQFQGSSAEGEHYDYYLLLQTNILDPGAVTGVTPSGTVYGLTEQVYKDA